jgi:hypothetical protein
MPSPRIISLVLLWLAALVRSAPVRADDWPQTNHDAIHSGRTLDEPAAPFRVEWVRQFPREVMTTRIEPVVASGRVFVGTYSGRMHAVDGKDGHEVWTRQLDGPILHSAAVGEGVCVVSTAAGTVFGLKTDDGAIGWRAQPGDHGFSTAPLLAGGLAILGGRGGSLYAYQLRTGRLKWRLPIGVPIRTTAASDGKLVYFAAEDLRARACELATGNLRWTSAPLPGQSARDYFPVIAAGKLVMRTNPAGHFAERLTRDRAMLASGAGLDGADWKAVDAFLKSNRAEAFADQIMREQRAIRDLLRSDSDARTLHILDCATGRETALAPVLYAAGCQGVGTPPVLAPDGKRLIVLYRSAYTNWSLGVAPFIGVGYLDSLTGALRPVRHASGAQPPWNTFWGTADESTRFTVAGNSLLLAHQGTIGSLDLKTLKLSTVAGKRDTWAGYPGVAWARNEWHGPARGAVAVSGDWLYWISGSRLIAVRGKSPGASASPGPQPPAGPGPSVPIETAQLPDVADFADYLRAAPSVPSPSPDPVEGPRLDASVAALLAETWRPLTVQPGLAGREIFFRRAAEKYEALLTAYPHVAPSLQKKIRETLTAEFNEAPPCHPDAVYPIDRGKPRQWSAALPAPVVAGAEESYPLFGMHAVWLYGTVFNDWDPVFARMDLFAGYFAEVKQAWPSLKKRRDIRANRLVADLLAYARIASRYARPEAETARRMAAEGVLELVAWMREFDPGAVERPVTGVAQLDAFIGRGDALFQAVKPHKGKIARLIGLTPELAGLLARYAPNHLKALFGTIDTMMPGWYLMGEERQVHFGENFVDYPDQALAIYIARAGAGFDSPEQLRTWIDMPYCRADLYEIQKRALYLSVARPDR